MALIFNAAGDSLRRTAALPASNAVSMSGWFKVTTLSGADGWRHLLGMEAADLTQYGLAQFFFGSPNALLIKVAGTSQEVSLSTGLSGVWVYLAWTSSGAGATDAKVWAWNASGVLLGSLTRAGLSLTPSMMGVGPVVGGGVGYTNLKCAYLRVWDAVLTQSEFETELPSKTVVRTANINTALGSNSSELDVSGNSRHWANNSIAFSAADEPLVVSSVAAKPAAGQYVVNTNAPYCPHLLLMCDEGTGSTLTNVGKGAANTFTLTAVGTGAIPAWDTFNGAACLSFAGDGAANGGAAYSSNISGITSQYTAIVIVRVPNVSHNQCMLSLAKSDASNVFTWIGGTWDRRPHSLTNVITGGTDIVQWSSTEVLTDTLRMVAVRFKQGENSISLDGSPWLTAALTAGHTFLNGENRLALGTNAKLVPDSSLNGRIFAAAVYADEYFTDAQIAEIWNDGDVWTSFGIDTTPIQVTRYVDTASAGGDGTTAALSGANAAYASLRTALTTEAKSLVAVNEQLTVVCRASSGVADNTANHFEFYAFSGWTTDATRFIDIVADQPSYDGLWDDTAYRVNGRHVVLSVPPPYTRIRNIQFQFVSAMDDNNSRNIVLNAAGVGVLISGCKFRCVRNDARVYGNNWDFIFRSVDATTGDPVTVANCVFYDTIVKTGVYVSPVESINCLMNVVNCTFIGDGVGTAIADGYSRVRSINNLVYNFASFNNPARTGTNYNATDLATGPSVGANNRNSQTFTFRDAAAKDFRLAANDAGARGYGTNLSADAEFAFSVDLAGNTRTTWDIGAYSDPSALVLGTEVALVAYDTNPAAVSVTVPAGTDTVWMFCTTWGGPLVNALGSQITLNGKRPDFVLRKTTTSMANVVSWHNPTAGSVLLDLNFGGSPGDGPVVFLLYTAGFSQAPVDAFVGAEGSGSANISDTLSVAAGDYVFAGYSEYRATGWVYPPLISGWTSLDTVLNRSEESGRLSYRVATGATQLVETGSIPYGKLAAIALRPLSATPLMEYLGSEAVTSNVPYQSFSVNIPEDCTLVVFGGTLWASPYPMSIQLVRLAGVTLTDAARFDSSSTPYCGLLAYIRNPPTGVQTFERSIYLGGSLAGGNVNEGLAAHLMYFKDCTIRDASYSSTIGEPAEAATTVNAVAGDLVFGYFGGVETNLNGAPAGRNQTWVSTTFAPSRGHGTITRKDVIGTPTTTVYGISNYPTIMGFSLAPLSLPGKWSGQNNYLRALLGR